MGAKAVRVFRYILAALVALYVAFPALADDSTKVDFGPFLVQYALPAFGVILTALAGWIAKKISTYYSLKNDDLFRQALQGAVTRGLALAQSQIAGAAQGNRLTVDVKNALVARGLQYVMEHEPEAAKALGYDPVSLAQKIEATLAVNTTPPETSVAVPTPPAA